MTHSSRFNYKAKSTQQKRIRDDVEARKTEITNAGFAVNEHLNEMTRIQSEVITCAGVARKCVGLLDERRDIGQEKFEPVAEAYDEKLEELPVRVVLRRLNQVLNLLGQRLETATDELEIYSSVLGELTEHAKSTSDVARRISRSLVETQHVGPRATSQEIREMHDAKERGEPWGRYGVSNDHESEDESDEEYANGA